MIQTLTKNVHCTIFTCNERILLFILGGCCRRSDQGMGHGRPLGGTARTGNHAQESEHPVHQVEHHRPHGNGADVCGVAHVSHDGRIHQSQQRNGDVRHYRRHGDFQYLFVSLIHFLGKNNKKKRTDKPSVRIFLVYFFTFLLFYLLILAFLNFYIFQIVYLSTIPLRPYREVHPDALVTLLDQQLVKILFRFVADV